MKKLLALSLLLIASRMHAQQGNAVVLHGTGAPAGSCAFIMFYVDDASGNLYDCKNGGWNLVTGGGGGTPGGALTDVQYYDTGGVFGGDAGFTYVKATHALTITGVMQAASYIGTGNSLLVTESTDPGTEAAGKDLLYGDSSAHAWLASYNGDTPTALMRIGSANTAGALFTLNMAAASATAAWKPPAAAGAAPTTQGVCAFDTTNNWTVCGDGTNTRHAALMPFITNVSNVAISSTCITGARCYNVIFGKGGIATVEANVAMPIGVAGTMTKLCVRILGTQGAVNTTFTLRDTTTASDTALTLTIAATSTAGQYCTSGLSAAVVATDDYSIEEFNSTGTASANIGGMYMLLTY